MGWLAVVSMSVLTLANRWPVAVCFPRSQAFISEETIGTVTSHTPCLPVSPTGAGQHRLCQPSRAPFTSTEKKKMRNTSTALGGLDAEKCKDTGSLKASERNYPCQHDELRPGEIEFGRLASGNVA